MGTNRAFAEIGQTIFRTTNRFKNVKLPLAILSFLLSLGATAQYHELGAMFSVGYYVGDLAPKAFHPQRFDPGGGLIYRYNFNDRVALKASALYNRLYAHDKNSEDSWQKNRNLHFRSDLFELSAQIEINFLTYEIGDERRPSSPYLFAGFALFRMNPKAEFRDRWVELQPLGTEGQGTSGGADRYSLTQLSIPFGVGYKFNIVGNLGGAVEWGMRLTFTDYLDDVSTVYVEQAFLEQENGPLAAELADRSLAPNGPEGTNAGMQRGDPSRNDWYVFGGIMLTYKLGKPRIKCPGAFN